VFKAAGSGLTDVVTFRENGDYHTVYYDQEIIVGKETDIDYGTDTITYKEYNINPVKYSLPELNKIASSIDFRSQITVYLEEEYKNNKELEMAGIATFLNMGLSKGTYWNHNVAGVKPVYDRIVLPVNVANAYPTRAEYNDGGGAYRQISGANGITRAGNLVDPAAGVFTVAQAEKARTYALYGGATPEAENRFLPPIVKIGGETIIQNELIAVLDEAAARQLRADQNFRDFAIRPLVDKRAPDYLSGSLYIGSYRGIHFYEHPWLPNHRLVDNGQTIAFNMLLGRNCYYTGYSGGVKMLTQEYNYGKTVGFTLSETRGVKALMKPSKTTPNKMAEFGIIFMPCNITNFL